MWLRHCAYLQNINRLIDLENEFMIARGEGQGEGIVWDGHVHTAIFKMDNEQGPTLEQRELCSLICGV